jgi:hypothetical protein
METLSTVIAEATNLALEENAEQVVGMIQGAWCIAHTEDLGRQAEMAEPTFLVGGGGVDKGHIDRGEITEDWELPNADAP